jgi:uncharacterized protein YbaR (Trm112 family)
MPDISTKTSSSILKELLACPLCQHSLETPNECRYCSLLFSSSNGIPNFLPQDSSDLTRWVRNISSTYHAEPFDLAMKLVTKTL